MHKQTISAILFIPILLIAATISLIACTVPKTSTHKPVLRPANIETATVLDIELTRINRKHIQLDNRTASAISNAQIFINNDYGTTIPFILVGKNPSIPLASFINEYGYEFPTGSMLRPENNKIVVTAELIINGKSHRLPVRLVDKWQRAY